MAPSRPAADDGHDREEDRGRDDRADHRDREDPESRAARDDRDRRDDREGATERRRSEFSDLVASSAVRLGLVAVGLVITVFALGQAVGVNFLGMIADALSTQTGQWLLVALFGILLILVAQRWVPARS